MDKSKTYLKKGKWVQKLLHNSGGWDKCQTSVMEHRSNFSLTLPKTKVSQCFSDPCRVSKPLTYILRPCMWELLPSPLIHLVLFSIEIMSIEFEGNAGHRVGQVIEMEEAHIKLHLYSVLDKVHHGNWTNSHLIHQGQQFAAVSSSRLEESTL